MKKYLKNAIIVLTLTPCFLSACQKKNQDTMFEKLKSLEGVTSCEKASTEGIQKYAKEAYIVKFSQPIDWKDSSKGTFNQKVYFFYNGDNLVTQYKCGGYLLSDYESTAASLKNNEMLNRYCGNIVFLEYRFFGESVPSGFSLSDTKYYDELNSYNACSDFHNIITKIQSLVKGKTIFTGGSKGGYTTETMSYYYPNDIDAYVSFVAPLCNGIYDERFYKNIFTTIGDNVYGKEEAAKKRQIVVDFAKKALSEEFRSRISNLVIDKSTKEGKTRITLNDDEIYELVIAEFCVGFYQYYHNYDLLSKVLAMKEDTEDDKTAKISAIADAINQSNPIKTDLYVENDFSPYYIQAITEMGDYYINLDYLRNAGANIKTNKSRDKDLLLEQTTTKAQRDAFSYSSSFRDNLIDYFRKTTKDVVKIVGLIDTWYAVRMDKPDNSHIHYFEAPESHISQISSLSESDQTQFWGVVDNLLATKS